VLGSINQDFVLKVEWRPEPGETLTNAHLSTHNGGKGANQAAAAALLGASPLRTDAQNLHSGHFGA
jgi:ribokinase